MKSRKLSQSLRFLQKDERKHADFSQPVVIGNDDTPKFFHAFAGEACPGKKDRFNEIMKDWVLSGKALLKVGELQKHECPRSKPPVLNACVAGSSLELRACSTHFNAESGFEGKDEFGSLLKE